MEVEGVGETTTSLEHERVRSVSREVEWMEVVEVVGGGWRWW
jgi:hypothetical protein